MNDIVCFDSFGFVLGVDFDAGFSSSQQYSTIIKHWKREWERLLLLLLLLLLSRCCCCCCCRGGGGGGGGCGLNGKRLVNILCNF